MIRPIRVLRSISLLVLLASTFSLAFGTDLSKTANSELIDQLTQVDARTLGIDGFGMYSGFIAEDGPFSFEEGLLGVPPPMVSPLLRELVRRGPSALPDLVAHINDSRPTRLEVGNTTELLAQQKRKSSFAFMWMIYSDEYDPRVREPLKRFSERAAQKPLERPFEGAYRVRVGDVCYVLVGQIVSRRLLAVRYQPTGGLVVNSPIEAPGLAEKVKQDWGATDAEGLKAALLSDMHWADAHEADSVDGESMKYLAQDVAYSALRRLRFYFPEIYKSLSGNDLKRKAKFEREEATAKSNAR